MKTLPQGRPIGGNVRDVCLLLDNDGPMTLSAIAKALDLLTSYARKYLRRAEEYGLVCREGDKYNVAPGWAARAQGKLIRLPPGVRGIHVRPPNSPWELSHGLQIAGTWPPAGAGRRYSPLGSWTEEAP